MSDDHTKVTRQETLAALKNPGELYVVMSTATKLPFVKCDEETYDDEVFLYYRVEDAKEKAKQLLAEKYLTAVARLEDRQLLAFYTSLYTMGVNCLAVNNGTDTQTSVQLPELVIRKAPSDGKKQIENPALHLTAIYFMQEMRRQEVPQLTPQMKELQEELLAHYTEGTMLVAVQEDGQIPVLKQKNGDVYQPVFTDLIEIQKFIKGKKVKISAIPASRIPDILVGDTKGVVINPLGVNVQLQISKKKKPV